MKLKVQNLFLSIFLALIFAANFINAQTKAEVLIVLGSDTAIWDGMSWNRYNNYYNPSLFTDPSDNTYEVMSNSFRDNLKDSYGQTMKLTWWMMAGNIFRYATNNNMPVPNIMTLYFMKKYHLESIEEFGDELTLHYHTVHWTDYNSDGRSYWNQSFSFMDCFDDFNYTLAQFLLEEEVFPVSFRSGWHYMDNGWQHYLNELLPFSMHNDYPSKRFEDEEPVDNIFDWSLAPSEWIPYHPSVNNYQIPGPSKGWNLRSMHLSRSISTNVYEDLFREANKGTDQVACIWGHLPEEDFNDNLVRINELLQEADQKYPYVKFRYCTAVEAMQRWLDTDDQKAPEISIEEISKADGIYYRITSDETIFQLMPVVAVKDIFENYFLLRCRKISDKTWETREPVSDTQTAKAAFAVTDYFGNQTIETIRYYPDDIFIDNQDEGYHEISGLWNTNTNAAWGTDSRKTQVQSDDSARVRFIPEIEQTGYYNIFIQTAGIDDPVTESIFKVYSDGNLSQKVIQPGSLPDKEWQYVATAELSEGTNNYLEVVSGQTGKWLAADVVKFSPLVTEKSLTAESEIIDLQSISAFDTTWFDLSLSSRGYEEITITDVQSTNGIVNFSLSFPLKIEPMKKLNIPIYIYSENKGSITDTVIVYSDDPVNNILKITVNAVVQNYFKVLDNEDADYVETGNWHTSVTQAHGNSSRYSFLSEPAGTKADFNFLLPKAGLYNIEYIVPTTVNSANAALYTISVEGDIIDSIYIDQNLNSGGWISLGEYSLPSQVPVTVSVINDKKSTEGPVLRADGMALSLIQEITDIAEDDPAMLHTFKLYQNYPNPFNPATTIKYSIPVGSRQYTVGSEKHQSFNHSINQSNSNVVSVQLNVYDILGREVAALVDEYKPAGNYKVVFDANSGGRNLPSGVYFYTLKAGSYQETKKLLLMK